MSASKAPFFGKKLAYSPREAAALLGLSHTHIWRQVREGKMPARRSGRCWLIPAQLIEEYGTIPKPELAVVEGPRRRAAGGRGR